LIVKRTLVIDSIDLLKKNPRLSHLMAIKLVPLL
jgi:hypothetical protein